jgi:hypothetical protein
MASWHSSQWSIYVSWLWFTEYLVNYTYKGGGNFLNDGYYNHSVSIH